MFDGFPSRTITVNLYVEHGGFPTEATMGADKEAIRHASPPSETLIRPSLLIKALLRLRKISPRDGGIFSLILEAAARQNWGWRRRRRRRGARVTGFDAH